MLHLVALQSIPVESSTGLFHIVLQQPFSSSFFLLLVSFLAFACEPRVKHCHNMVAAQPAVFVVSTHKLVALAASLPRVDAVTPGDHTQLVAQPPIPVGSSTGLFYTAMQQLLNCCHSKVWRLNCCHSKVIRRDTVMCFFVTNVVASVVFSFVVVLSVPQ
jgi:hypothetical protein